MEDRSRPMLATAIFFAVLSWTAVALRVYVRCFMRKIFGVDDWLMVVTQVFFSGYLACQLGGIAYGTGRHIWDLEREDAEKALNFWWWCEVFYVISTGFLKVSVGFFLLRIAVKKAHIWILRIFMIATVLFSTAFALIVIFQCNPISAWWTLERKGCIDAVVIANVVYAASAVNSVADWLFASLPVFMVWKLNQPRKMKILIAGILSLAAIGSVATIVRLPYTGALGKVDDFLYETTDFAIWSTVEIGLGVTAACSATLRPLVQRVTQKYSRNASFGTDPTLVNGGRSSYRRNYRAGFRQQPLTVDGWDAEHDTTALSERPKDGVGFTNHEGGSDEDAIFVDRSVTVSYSARQPAEPMSPIETGWPERSRSKKMGREPGTSY